MPLTISHIRTYLTEFHIRNGFTLIETPIIDDAELFLTRAGNQVIESLFTFERRGMLKALRPEFTTTAMAKYVAEQLTHTVRWQFFGYTFEEQSGQTPSQHLVAGFENINADGSYTDAMAITIAFRGLQTLGVNRPMVVINHAGLPISILQYLGLDRRDALRILKQNSIGSNDTPRFSGSLTQSDARSVLDNLLDTTQYGRTMGGRTRDDIALRLVANNKSPVSSEIKTQAAQFVEVWHSQDWNTNWEAILLGLIADDDDVSLELAHEFIAMLDTVVADGLPREAIRLDFNLSQNWEYYTGITFQIHNGDQLVASGGRYNDLGRLISGDRHIPAIGVAYYLDTLVSSERTVDAVIVRGANVQEMTDIVATLHTHAIPAYSEFDPNASQVRLLYTNHEYDFQQLAHLISIVTKEGV